jgi:NTE family protein
MSSKKTTVSLVLGSGGARGLAHIGVIRWLVENNYRIKSISGSSIGALIGGIYASGNLAKYEEWVLGIRKIDIISLLDIAWTTHGGLVRGDKIINTLIELLGDQLIEDLPLSFTAVASDIKHEKEVWINSGSLFDAIRASISMPIFFTPVMRNDAILIDGGVLNPMPIAPTFGDQTDLTIAVSLGGAREKQCVKVADKPSEEKPVVKVDSHIHKKIMNFISNFRNGYTVEKYDTWGALDVINLSLDAMQSAITRQKLASYPADYIIEIARNSCGILEFHRAQEMIDLGYQKAGLMLPGKNEQQL